MPNIIADFLIERIQANGWFSIGNIMFEDIVPCINPTSSGGFVCLSKSKQLIFSAVRMDTHMSYVIEEGYLAQDSFNHGVQQTIVCEPFDRLRQFDVLTLSTFTRWNKDKTEIIPPKYPKVSDVEALTVDPDTGLYDPSKTDTITMIDGIESSAIDVFPDFNIPKQYVGVRVNEYKQFIKNQKAFCAYINKFFGLTDCM